MTQLIHTAQFMRNSRSLLAVHVPTASHEHRVGCSGFGGESTDCDHRLVSFKHDRIYLLFFWGGGLFGVWFVGGVGSKKSYFPHFCSVGVEDESGEAASQNRRCDRGSAGIVFVGGFSYADVLDSAKGWAGSIRRNPALWASFLRFYHRFVSGRGPLLDYFPSLPPTPIHKIILHLMLALSVPHCRSFQPPLPVPQPRLPVPSTPFTGPPNPLCRSPQTPLPVPPTPFAGSPTSLAGPLNPLCRRPQTPFRAREICVRY